MVYSLQGNTKYMNAFFLVISLIGAVYLKNIRFEYSLNTHAHLYLMLDTGSLHDNDKIFTYLSQMNLFIIIIRASPFPVLGVLGGIFHFFPNFNETFFKQTVKSALFANVQQKRH